MVRVCKRIYLIALLCCAVISLSVSAAIKPALWQVEHQNKLSYIFGSIHVGEASWYPLPALVKQAYNDSHSLVVELDMDSHISKVQQAMVLASGGNLEQELSPATFKRLTQYLNDNNIPLSSITPLKTWAVANTLAILPFLKLGLSPQYGVDTHFIALAKQTNKPIIELETIDFQLKLLISLFDNEQALIDVMDTPETEVIALIDSWKTGQLDSIEHLLSEQITPEQYQIMLVNRNNRWTKQLTTQLKTQGGLFMVVGAAHLVGSDGLPAKLKQQGFKVTRIQ